MLEEAFSRKEFKRQILEAIEEERIEFEKFLNNPVVPDITSGNMEVETYWILKLIDKLNKASQTPVYKYTLEFEWNTTLPWLQRLQPVLVWL